MEAAKFRCFAVVAVLIRDGCSSGLLVPMSHLLSQDSLFACYPCLFRFGALVFSLTAGLRFLRLYNVKIRDRSLQCFVTGVRLLPLLHSRVLSPPQHRAILDCLSQHSQSIRIHVNFEVPLLVNAQAYRTRCCRLTSIGLLTLSQLHKKTKMF